MQTVCPLTTTLAKLRHLQVISGMLRGAKGSAEAEANLQYEFQTVFAKNALRLAVLALASKRLAKLVTEH